MKKLLLSVGILLLSVSSISALPLDRMISLRTGKADIQYERSHKDYNFIRELKFAGKGGAAVLQLTPTISVVYSKYDHKLTHLAIDVEKKYNVLVESFILPLVLTGMRDGTVHGELTRETTMVDFAIAHSEYAKISVQVGTEAISGEVNILTNTIDLKEENPTQGAELELFLTNHVSASWSLSGVGSGLKETKYSLNFSY